jgi:hypothetical protein
MQAKWLWFTFPALIVSVSLAQKPQKASIGTEPTAASIPTSKLTFIDVKDAPRVAASQVVYSPMGCTPDGSIFIEAAPRSDFTDIGLSSVAVGNDGLTGTSFSIATISDLHDARLRSYFATESEVVVLVNATPDDALSTSKRVTVVPSTGQRIEREVKSGTRHDYLATFDRQGNYKGAAELDVPFTPRRIAVFNSGLFLVIGFDTDKKTRFAFVNADGSLQRFLDTEKPLLGSEKMMEALGLLKAQSPEFRANPHPELGLAEIVAFHDNLLFVLGGMTWILEISPSGAIRRIAIDVPTGLVIDHLIPSERMLYVAMRRFGADHATQDADEVFYEVSPANGALTKRFDTAPEYVSAIACEHDGDFLALAYDTNGLILRRGKP